MSIDTMSSYDKLDIMSSKKPDTRSRILSATRKLMEEKKGAGVTMLDIARESGISRQAVYLHFESRAELLIATTRYLDGLLDLDKRYSNVRETTSGLERLEAFIEFWGNYIPRIYGIAKALLAALETDEDAAAAWNDRMEAVRSGCRTIIEKLKEDGKLSDEWSEKDATDLLWTLLSVRNWEQLTTECKWSKKKYILSMQALAKRSFVKSSAKN